MKEKISLYNRNRIELIALIATIIFSLLILLPILNADIDFFLLPFNFAYCVVLLTLFRYLLFWDYHPLRYSKVGKILLIFLVPISFFILIEGIHSFVEFRDQVGLHTLVDHLDYKTGKFYVNYLEKEYMFFSVGSLICAILMIFKMIRSLWRQYKFNI